MGAFPTALVLGSAGCGESQRIVSRQEPLYSVGACRKQKLLAMSKLIDAHIGDPFPNVALTETSTGKSTSLSALITARGSESTTSAIHFLNIGSGRPFTKAGLDYFRDDGWKSPDRDPVTASVDICAWSRLQTTPTTLLGALPPTRFQTGCCTSDSFLDRTRDTSSKRLERGLSDLDDAWRYAPTTLRDRVPESERQLVDTALHRS